MRSNISLLFAGHIVKKVTFLARILTHYRVPFHEAVRARLAEFGVEYNLIYGTPTEAEATKGDLADVPWGRRVKTTYLGKSCYMHVGDLHDHDLIVIGQELKNLNNYPLQLRRRIGLGPKLAYFGHGRNFQSQAGGSLKEKFKSVLVREVDWWFGYTEKTLKIVQLSGFPAQRVTVFNNSVDIKSLRSQVSSISDEQRAGMAENLGVSRNCAIYIGGLYPEKRIEFLIDAAKILKKELSDFSLIIVGGGVDQKIAESAASEHSWIKYLGPKFGQEKALIASLAQVMLLPGLVGLAVLDSFAYGLPLVTTNIPWHSPEIDYLKDGQNGCIVDDFGSEHAYASAVLRIFQDDALRSRLSTGAAHSASEYSIENMADRFAVGVMNALSTPSMLLPRRLPK